jgi:hypothetical protein
MPFMAQIQKTEIFLKDHYFRYKVLLFFLFSLTFTLFNTNKFFFWDSISQISIPANWYYDNNFRYFFVPAKIATGHPTFAGMYLALVWKLFGKSLFVSHLAMLPFIFGILMQIDEFLKDADKGKIIPLLIILVIICDATLVSQMSMVTFDILQIFFFLSSINALMKERYICLSFAFTALVITSLRGSVSGFGIILYSFLVYYGKNGRISLRSLIPFIPGILAIAAFLCAFFFHNHWVIHNKVSKNWEQSAEFASFPEILRNIGLVGWRLIDYGRFGIWVILVFIMVISFKRKSLFDNFFKNTLYVALCQFLVFFPLVIIYRNPFGHRYFLTIIIPVSIAVIYWILKYSKFRIMIYTLNLALVLSGYFWIYPLRIAQGWDATPAHWPYYSMRKEMLEYLRLNDIPVENTGSFFPNTASFKLIDLSEENRSFHYASIENDKYILFSNVYNLKDDIIDELFFSGNWIKKKIINKGGVLMILFARIH